MIKKKNQIFFLNGFMILCYQTKYLVLHNRIVELLESEALVLFCILN